jgi:hypothetical protein
LTIEEEPAKNKTDKHKGFQVSKAQVNLMQVTRDGKLRIKIMAPIMA